MTASGSDISRDIGYNSARLPVILKDCGLSKKPESLTHFRLRIRNQKRQIPLFQCSFCGDDRGCRALFRIRDGLSSLVRLTRSQRRRRLSLCSFHSEVRSNDKIRISKRLGLEIRPRSLLQQVVGKRVQAPESTGFWQSIQEQLG